MKKHANRNDNDADHHLYEIFDHERRDIYKYGICGDRSTPTAPRPALIVRSKKPTVW